MSIQYLKLVITLLIGAQFGLLDSDSVLLASPRLTRFQDTPTQSSEAAPDKTEQDPDADLLLFSNDFESGLTDWEFSDAKAWKLGRVTDTKYSMIQLFTKASEYKPKHRSPLHQAILKDHEFGSFELTVDVRSTHESYGHRDACLFFGYQNPNQFYYVHLGQATDPHCNQIFIVNNADRSKITLTTNEGTKWDEKWHQVRIVRNIESGTIEVYFDKQSKPVMTAEDKTFLNGRIGIGSFDDTADWAKLRVRKLEPSAKDGSPQIGKDPAADGQ